MSASNFSASSLLKTFIKYGLLCWVLQRLKCKAHVHFEFRVHKMESDMNCKASDKCTRNKGCKRPGQDGRAVLDVEKSRRHAGTGQSHSQEAVALVDFSSTMSIHTVVQPPSRAHTSIL